MARWVSFCRAVNICLLVYIFECLRRYRTVVLSEKSEGPRRNVKVVSFNPRMHFTTTAAQKSVNIFFRLRRRGDPNPVSLGMVSAVLERFRNTDVVRIYLSNKRKKIPNRNKINSSWFTLVAIWISVLLYYCCDRKARAASEQSFALWQQATIEFTCHDHFIIACSRHIHMGAVLRAHPVPGESHKQRNANR